MLAGGELLSMLQWLGIAAVLAGVLLGQVLGSGRGRAGSA
jgi:hypothetical protein